MIMGCAMNKKTLILTLLIVILLTGLSFAKERLLITEGQLQALEPGREVSINRILDDGNLLCVVGTGKGQNVKLLILNPLNKKVLKSVEVPLKTINYVASNSDGSAVIVYSQYQAEFYVANVKNGTSKLLFKREKGKPGFSLYSERRSRITFINGVAAAWGFFYDYKNQFDAEYVTLVNPAESGLSAFKKVMKTNRLRSIAKTYMQYAKAVGAIEMNKEFLTFAALKDKGGCMIGFDLKKNLHFKIDQFRSFSGAEIARTKPLLAYIVKKSGDAKNEGVLYLFNLKTKKKVEVAKGKLFKPVFSPSGNTLIVGKGVAEGKKIKTNLLLIKIEGDKFTTKSINFGKTLSFIDWKLVKNDKCLMLFTGKNLYKYDLK